MRQPHDVPLSNQVLAVINNIWSMSEGGDLVFPSIRSKQRYVVWVTARMKLRLTGPG